MPITRIHYYFDNNDKGDGKDCIDENCNECNNDKCKPGEFERTVSKPPKSGNCPMCGADLVLYFGTIKYCSRCDYKK